MSKAKEKPEVTLESLQNSIAAMQAANGQIRKRMTRFVEMVRAYDPKYMLEMEARHDVLSGRLQNMIEKTTVSTEIAFYARKDGALNDSQRAKLLEAVIFCFDQPDEWWKHNGERSILQWAKICIQTHREHLLHQATLTGRIAA